MRQRDPRHEDQEHRKWIARLPCLLCGAPAEAAHVSYSDTSIAKRSRGISEKVHDFFCIPLCRRCHDEQHAMNELKFWSLLGIDPNKIALRLYQLHVHDDFETAERVCEANRR